MAKYGRVSERLMTILHEFTDLVEQVSIDEAFLDVTGSRKLFGSGADIGRSIKARIIQDQQLTASVGVAANKFVAKVASDLQKPDGLVVVEPGREQEFLAPLPVRRLWGVGPKTEKTLDRLGIRLIGDIVRFGRGEMIRRLGQGGDHLWHLAQGFDDRPVAPEKGFRSIGHETTFEHDTGDVQLLHDTLLALTEKVTHRLRAHHTLGRTITVKLREADFSTSTRRTRLPKPVDTMEKIFPVAWKLMQSLIRTGKLVRLIGVYASDLVALEEAGQLSLFTQAPEKDRQIAAALDDIARRYGDHAVTRAALVSPKKKRP
jgi:DNA polymerase-4